MSENGELSRQVAQLLGEILCIEINPSNVDARLIDDYGANSMDVVDIAERLEREFDVTISNDDIQRLKTLDDIVGLIRSQKSEVA